MNATSRLSMSDGQAGTRFRAALALEHPLRLVGVPDGYAALLAEREGFHALYLSGAGVASARGLPDLGIIALEDVAEDARRITGISMLPLLADADTGWGGPLMIARAVRTLAQAGVAGLHLEDQVDAKRCGHRPGKRLVSAEEMEERVRAAVEAKPDPSFVVMARTDARTVEGLEAAIARGRRYVAAGADMLFAEAFAGAEEYRALARATGVPILANVTEFGLTPLLTAGELAEAGVTIALYPLSVFRAQAAAAVTTLRAIREKGTQRDVVDRMQTRDEWYEVLRYQDQERRSDGSAREEAS